MNFIKKFLCGLFLLLGVCTPNMAFAGWGLLDVDSLDVSGLIPIVLSAFMEVADGTYSYFVSAENGGLIYLLVWGFLILYITTYLLKLYMPKFWLSTFGFKSGDSIDNTGGTKIAENLLKPAIRAIVAATILLPAKPEFITSILINPLLQFGSIYTSEIMKISSDVGFGRADEATIVQQDCQKIEGWLTKESCEYLVQPVHVLSHANNTVIKRGFRYLSSGLTSLLTLMIHDGGQGFMNIITGLLLIATFVGCNVFMALLIIQAIFSFGMAIILYPFSVAAWVAKKDNSWFNPWPAFSGIIEGLKKIVITMIACAFILCVNMALVSALFQWNNRLFVAAAGGIAYSNVPSVNSISTGFGGHSVLWLSCLLTFMLMQKMFEITKDKLTGYAGKDSTALYEQVKSDAKTTWGIVKNIPGKTKSAWKFIKGE